MTNKQLYRIMIDAVDEEGPFFQNLYVYGKTPDDSIYSTLKYLEKCNYKNIKVEEVELVNLNQIPDNLIEDDDLDGYIQNVKYGYPEEDLEV